MIFTAPSGLLNNNTTLFVRFMNEYLKSGMINERVKHFIMTNPSFGEHIYNKWIHAIYISKDQDDNIKQSIFNSIMEDDNILNNIKSQLFFPIMAPPVWQPQFSKIKRRLLPVRNPYNPKIIEWRPYIGPLGLVKELGSYFSDGTGNPFDFYNTGNYAVLNNNDRYMKYIMKYLHKKFIDHWLQNDYSNFLMKFEIQNNKLVKSEQKIDDNPDHISKVAEFIGANIMTQKITKNLLKKFMIKKSAIWYELPYYGQLVKEYLFKKMQKLINKFHGKPVSSDYVDKTDEDIF